MTPQVGFMPATAEDEDLQNIGRKDSAAFAVSRLYKEIYTQCLGLFHHGYTSFTIHRKAVVYP